MEELTWLTVALAVAAGCAAMAKGGLLIWDATSLRQGKGVVYQGPLGNRLRVAYDDGRVHDTECPSAVPAVGATVDVWAFRDAPDRILHIGERPANGAHAPALTPGIFCIVIGALAIAWYVSRMLWEEKNP